MRIWKRTFCKGSFQKAWLGPDFKTYIPILVYLSNLYDIKEGTLWHTEIEIRENREEISGLISISK